MEQVLQIFSKNLNDPKYLLSFRKNRHMHIGQGYIGEVFMF